MRRLPMLRLRLRMRRLVEVVVAALGGAAGLRPHVARRPRRTAQPLLAQEKAQPRLAAREALQPLAQEKAQPLPRMARRRPVPARVRAPLVQPAAQLPLAVRARQPPVQQQVQQRVAHRAQQAGLRRLGLPLEAALLLAPERAGPRPQPVAALLAALAAREPWPEAPAAPRRGARRWQLPGVVAPW
jgi:hypothetical protein